MARKTHIHCVHTVKALAKQGFTDIFINSTYWASPCDIITCLAFSQRKSLHLCNHCNTLRTIHQEIKASLKSDTCNSLPCVGACVCVCLYVSTDQPSHLQAERVLCTEAVQRFWVAQSRAGEGEQGEAFRVNSTQRCSSTWLDAIYTYHHRHNELQCLHLSESYREISVVSFHTLYMHRLFSVSLLICLVFSLRNGIWKYDYIVHEH